MVLEVHTEFRGHMLQHERSWEKNVSAARAEVNTINTLFPRQLSDDIRICFAAWLCFACAADDILETISPDEGEAVLYECIGIVQGYSPFGGPSHTSDTRIQHMAEILHSHCSKHLSRSTCRVFFQEVCAVLQAHVDEKYFLSGRLLTDMPTYMTIRSRTISLNPFFEIIKAECLPEIYRLSPTWQQLQHHVSSTAGLQNDLIGLERDLEEGEQLNAVVVLMAANNSDQPPGAQLAACVALAVAEHNKSIAQVVALVSCVAKLGETMPDSVADTLLHISLLCETHLRWATSAKRYKASFDTRDNE
ncbi:hypothetical protein QQS21_000177 [Conoideocrella luteorostrata]|uniref:Uncharacterized protein n=1 Tax=Conoideocrella luteorostrata TaxID=1105319 RepID=A0AAJ0D1H6_9HYPO|nr:hypothetical protein QQS21_000177 [Conoideocrella luteorostrata]